ncbi:hypothetical protein PBRA_007043 [Plasmodiophora brassicae]|uniref:Uncharacterized protein n=1 Tax=Plasmodiophora brassicae TaxID=37360 RepID=A0A0G4IUW4_PLABS|nr:hypothetical protein PBRA_007043 [Plasmodiophora brassicae]
MSTAPDNGRTGRRPIDMENVPLQDPEKRDDLGPPPLTDDPHRDIESMAIDAGAPQEHMVPLNVTSLLIIGALVAVWFVVYFLYPTFSLAYPLFFVPFGFLVWRSHTTNVVSPNDTIKTYAIAFATAPFILLLMVILLNMAHPLVRHVRSVYLSILLLLFAQVSGEEAYKFFMIRSKTQRLGSESEQEAAIRLSDLRHCLFSSMAISLGYGTYQGLVTSALLSSRAQTMVLPLVISTLIAFLYIPFHVMTGYLIGLQLGRRAALNENVHSAFVIIPIVFRTLFLFQFFYWATSRHPFLLWFISSAAIIVSFAYYIRSIKKRLPAEFLQSAGYNQLIGYIPIVDDEFDG